MRFWENRKKSKNGCFSQLYNLDAIAHAGASHLGVEWLRKILWKPSGQFLRNLKFSLKGRKKKNDTIA